MDKKTLLKKAKNGVAPTAGEVIGYEKLVRSVGCGKRATIADIGRGTAETIDAFLERRNSGMVDLIAASFKKVKSLYGTDEKNKETQMRGGGL